MAFTVRLATSFDTPAVVGISVRVQRFVYRGIVPDSVLDAQVETAEEQGWTQLTEGGESERRLWVADDDGVVGFCETGPSGDEDAAPLTAAVGWVYMDPDRVGAGLGRLLFDHALEDLRKRGFKEVTTWILRDKHRFQTFYGVRGWEPDEAERTREFGRFPLTEVRCRLNLSVS